MQQNVKEDDDVGVCAGGLAVPADWASGHRGLGAEKSGSGKNGTRARPNPYAKATEGPTRARPKATRAPARKLAELSSQEGRGTKCTKQPYKELSGDIVSSSLVPSHLSLTQYQYNYSKVMALPGGAWIPWLYQPDLALK
ncbi:hypothetical protein C8R43DRAFT_948002 [Mycena crocata]|nr:hypothetical protein C8R43DRAFT_948002 [Mycena crocata]